MQGDKMSYTAMQGGEFQKQQMQGGNVFTTIGDTRHVTCDFNLQISLVHANSTFRKEAH